MAGSCQPLGVAEVLKRFAEPLLDRYGHTLRLEQRVALQSILLCRTEAMGGHRYHCPHCREDHFVWHSCNHRLCPRCGAADTAQWVGRMLVGRLPVTYFMVTFTLPSPLRRLCQKASAETFYRLFFACCAQTLKEVLGQRRHLGGESGFFGMLQSWQQDLRLHPHIHFIVPAVALGANGKVRFPPKAGWLARGEIFASRLRTLLLKALQKEELLSVEQAEGLWKISWNCHVEDFGSGENAIKYLGQYVSKGPLCDARILAVHNDSVSIAMKDRTSAKPYCLQLDAIEFVRRYLLHALPNRFHRIRYYGFLHSKAKKKLAQIRQQLPPTQDSSEEQNVAKTQHEEKAPCFTCPRCGHLMQWLGPQSRAPPPACWTLKIWKKSIPKAA